MLEDRHEWVCAGHDIAAAEIADAAPEICRVLYCCRCGRRIRHVESLRLEEWKKTPVPAPAATEPNL